MTTKPIRNALPHGCRTKRTSAAFFGTCIRTATYIKSWLLQFSHVQPRSLGKRFTCGFTPLA